MSIERGKDTGYRRSRAGLVVAVLILTAALLFTLAHQLHWPVVVHGVIVIALVGAAVALLFTARGWGPRTARGGDTRRREGSGHDGTR